MWYGSRAPTRMGRLMTATLDDDEPLKGWDPISVPEAAKRYDLTEDQVRLLIRQGRIPAKSVGGRWIIDASRVAIHPPPDSRFLVQRRIDWNRWKRNGNRVLTWLYAIGAVLSIESFFGVGPLNLGQTASIFMAVVGGVLYFWSSGITAPVDPPRRFDVDTGTDTGTPLPTEPSHRDSWRIRPIAVVAALAGLLLLLIALGDDPGLGRFLGATPVATASPSATATFTPTPTMTPTETPTATPISTPTATPMPTTFSGPVASTPFPTPDPRCLEEPELRMCQPERIS
jgi:hypothetical protein